MIRLPFTLLDTVEAKFKNKKVSILMAKSAWPEITPEDFLADNIILEYMEDPDPDIPWGKIEPESFGTFKPDGVILKEGKTVYMNCKILPPGEEKGTPHEKIVIWFNDTDYCCANIEEC